MHLAYQNWVYAMNSLFAEVKNQHKYVFALRKKKERKKPTPLSCFTNLWIQLIFNMEVKSLLFFFSPFKPDIYF